VFDTGNLSFVKQLLKEGLLAAPTLIQLCTGIPYGVPADVGHPPRNGELSTRRVRLVVFRHQSHANAVGRTVGAPRRQRARGP